MEKHIIYGETPEIPEGPINGLEPNRNKEREFQEFLELKKNHRIITEDGNLKTITNFGGSIQVSDYRPINNGWKLIKSKTYLLNIFNLKWELYFDSRKFFSNRRSLKYNTEVLNCPDMEL